MNITKDTFQTEVLESTQPTLIDFWAPWCGPCKAMAPVVEALDQELEGVKVGKVNVDDAPELAQQYNVLSIPTFAIFKNGQVVDQFSGSMTKEQLMDRVGKHL